MSFKLYILFLVSSLAVELNAQSSDLTTDFGARCFTIVQPLLQDIADKRLKYDQCDKTIEEKDNKLSETQTKLDQLQTKLSVAATVVQEKERQIGHHAELCNTHKNNSLIKDELLKTYKTHYDTNVQVIKSKDEHIKRLQAELQQNEQIFKNFTEHMLQKEAQILQLSFEASKDKAELDDHRTQLSTKNKELEELQKKLKVYSVELIDLSGKLKMNEAQLATLQANCKEVSAQLAAAEGQIDKVQIQMDFLKTQLNVKDAQLLKCQNKLEMLQLPNCYWYGNSSDIQKIRAPDMEPFAVLCDSQLAGPGWTVIQRRLNGAEDFYRSWTDYRNGFGNLQSEFFIGLEKLHRLTQAQPYELYVYLQSFDNQTYFARYSDFRVGSEHEAYEIKSLGKYSGNAGDGLLYAKYRKFSTFDADHDRDTINCAVDRHGGWWYDRCGHSNLNGKYFETPVKHSWSISWLGVQSFSFKTVQMMLRPTMVK